MITSRRILLLIKNVSDKFCRENQVTHFTFNNIFMKIVPSMRQFGKSFVQPDEPQMMAHALCMLDKMDTNTHTQNTEYVVLIVFPWLRRLREHASVLSYTFVVCLAITPLHCPYCFISSSSSSAVHLNILLLASARPFYILS